MLTQLNKKHNTTINWVKRWPPRVVNKVCRRTISNFTVQWFRDLPTEFNYLRTRFRFFEVFRKIANLLLYNLISSVLLLFSNLVDIWLIYLFNYHYSINIGFQLACSWNDNHKLLSSPFKRTDYRRTWSLRRTGSHQHNTQW